MKEENNDYMNSRLKKVLKPLTKELLKKKPKNILRFIEEWAHNLRVILKMD